MHQNIEKMRKISILASGEGTNAERIIRYFQERRTAEVVLVLVNRRAAGAVRRAESLGVPVEYVGKAGFESGEALAVLKRYGTEFVVLAGFLLHIPDDILHEYPDAIINIHPSLLPKHGGKGMYGERVHEAVLSAGETESGITIHYVNEHYDQGTIIFQARCPVATGDTPHSLATRVHQLEYQHFPEVIERLVTAGKPIDAD